LAELTAFDPVGPYFLGGWSFGGYVAYEMACRLEAAGRQVALLALFDSSAAQLARPSHPDECDIMAQAVSRYATVTAEELRALPPERRLARVLELVEESGAAVPDSFGRDWLERRLAVYRGLKLAVRGYRPSVYGGSVVLWRAEESFAHHGGEETLGWGALARSVDVRPVPCWHHELMTGENVRKVARHLRGLLGIAPPAGGDSAAPPPLSPRDPQAELLRNGRRG
jgi:thioesterase domain-containing protein